MKIKKRFRVYDHYAAEAQQLMERKTMITVKLGEI
jgi:hypothetical protein